jgi:acetyl/propionyl-CoA carboxylase alpha subunit
MAEAEKITFIGPSSSSYSLMGNKIAVRNLMKQNNIPIVPGTINRFLKQKGKRRRKNQIPLFKSRGRRRRQRNEESLFRKEFFPLLNPHRGKHSMLLNGEIYIEKFLSVRSILRSGNADKHGNYTHLSKENVRSKTLPGNY